MTIEIEQSKIAQSDNMEREVYVFPTSFAQRRYLMLEGLSSGNPALIIAVNFRLMGNLSFTAFENAVQALVLRHEILRTTFTVIDGDQVQVVAPNLKTNIPFIDISVTEETGRAGLIQALIREEALEPFDLARGPLFRIRIIKINSAEHILQVTLHHIICDGWSNGVFIRDLCALYTSAIENKPAALPELPIQFADYAAYEMQVSNEQIDGDLDYWLNQVGKEVPILNFPTDRPRGARNFRSEQANLMLSDSLTSDVKEFCNREALTLYMVFLGAFEILLYRHTGQADIIVGSPAANRSPETEDLIGPFVNPIILRNDLSGDLTVSQLLKDIRKSSLEALKHQSMPFERLLEALERNRVPGFNRLFQFEFLYQRAFLQPHQMPDLLLTPFPAPLLGTQAELSFGLVERNDGIKIQVPYLVALFDESTIVKLLHEFEQIVARIVADPNQRVAQFRSNVIGAAPIKPAVQKISARQIIAPRNLDEKKLLEIWRELLGERAISVSDDFFDLGGHSLQVIRLIARLENLYGKRLPLSTFMRGATIERLASILRDTPSPNSYVRIPRRPDGVSVPLSSPQQRFWYFEQLSPGHPVFIVPLMVGLRGKLNINAMQAALHAIVQRHESLRTRFGVVNGEPVQSIQSSGDFPLTIVDLSRESDEDRERRKESLINSEINRGFDFYKGPLIRGCLIGLGEQEHVLLLTMHHIVCDGWSLGIILRELTVFYQAILEGGTPQLPELRLQYADFAYWQRKNHESQQNQIAHWKRVLGGELAILDLPTDFPRQTVKFSGATTATVIPNFIVEPLKALSQKEGTTLFVTALAVFYVLLSRYTGQTDILLGTFVANRPRTELEDLVGIFINTLVMRARLNDNPKFRDLVRRTNEYVVDAFENQEVPFERLIEELQVKRDPTRHPLFQVSFVVQQPFLERKETAGLEFMPMPALEGRMGSMFDISVSIVERADGLRCRVFYDSDLYRCDTIQRMLNHFQVLLEKFGANPDCKINSVRIHSEPEILQWASSGCQVSQEYPRDRCVHHLFETRAEKSPGAIAVSCNGSQITYGDLNKQANQLAHHLQKMGVSAESIVGICVDRSINMVLGVLGILKAGGVYVPIDPVYPRDRVKNIVEDSKLKLLVTQQKYHDRFASHGLATVRIDTDLPQIQMQPDENLAVKLLPENLAYIIFTSGSTGRPKGVQVYHYSLVNVLTSVKETMDIKDADRLLAVSSLSFDIAGVDIFLPLISGARVEIATHEATRDGSELIKLLDRSAATMMQATPATWRMLIDAGWTGRKNLKMLAGGEALTRELSDELLSRGGYLWNGYGPTETTIYSSITRVERGDKPVGIGAFVRNTQLYVLDIFGQLAPVGVSGELYIGGDGIARGYINQPELTTARFVPDPFSGRPGALLYKTGDIVQRKVDGTLEYIGRSDHQVKMRGYRIELGEIESVLRKDPHVRNSVAMVIPAAGGEKQLVAYALSNHSENALKDGLKALLKDHLPDYMQPSHIMVLNEFPISPNGKVDRNALPIPGAGKNQTPTGPLPARNPLEEEILEIWKDLLNIQEIGVRDDFFALGGHSLLAVRMMYRIEQAYGRKLPTSILFSGATIEFLARALLDQEHAQLEQPVLCIRDKGTKNPLFFLHGDILGGGFYCLSLARYLDAERPFYAVAPQGLDGCDVQGCIEDMAEYHLAQIRKIQPEGPYNLGGYCNGGLIAFEIARRLRAQGQKVHGLFLIDSSASNVQHRYLRGAVDRLGRILGWENTKINNCFLLWRNRAIRSRRIREIAAIDLISYPARVLHRRTNHLQPLSSHPPLPTKPKLSSEYRESLLNHYLDLINGYVPKSYDGCVTLLWTDAMSQSKTDPSSYWKAIAKKVEVYTLPTGHQGFTTKSIQAMAEKINNCLA